MSHDVIIVGGSFAGLAAALQLARARRRVLVIDAGQRRNRFSHAAHGFLGQDGRAPATIIQEARARMAAYPTATVADAVAEHARPTDTGFEVALADGARHRAAQLILATGVVDELPAIPGLSERWGRSVLHCPYCHGHEVAGGRLGVLATGPLSLHQALLIPDWGAVTFFTNGQITLDADQRALLRDRRVAIEEAPVAGIEGDAPALTGVRLRDGRAVALDALFTSSRVRQASPLAEQLGCALDDGPFGPIIRVDARQRTTVAGVYAAGDAARMMQNISFAVADGAFAGISAHQATVPLPHL
jgi:thioredoxin reductase